MPLKPEEVERVVGIVSDCVLNGGIVVALPFERHSRSVSLYAGQPCCDVHAVEAIAAASALLDYMSEQACLITAKGRSLPEERFEAFARDWRALFAERRGAQLAGLREGTISPDAVMTTRYHTRGG